MKESKRCSMRRMENSDLDYVLVWRNSPETRKNMYTSHEITAEEHLAWFDRVQSDSSKQYFIFEIEGVPVGVIAYVDINLSSKCCSWAFYSGNTAVRGVGSLMEYYAINYAFNELGMGKLYCEVLSYNESVIRFHRKHGFSVEGIFRKQHQFEGELFDVYRLALFKIEWVKYIRPQIDSKMNNSYRVNSTFSKDFFVTCDDINSFSKLTGDDNPIHVDSDYAISVGFEDRIAHGQLLCSLVATVFGTEFPGNGTILLAQKYSFHKPVYANSLCSLNVKVLSRVGRKLLAFVSISNKDDQCCISGEVELFVPVDDK
ncbi:MAG: UDP-4-amino-4,6-dideoxy-N-acetyl-beta-L-altrosamine N-acetyltransferase [Gammaproteobacteria bacterium]|nr:UDP-4-amino-4,6-dideoxy-N-acetyl-beta-L-altrosamine N-acetyltransferase [Gammaproteobacteria bacterium]